MTTKELKQYIINNNDVLGTDLYLINSFISLAPNAEANQHMFNLLNVIVNGTFSDKLEAVKSYDELKNSNGWCIGNDIHYKALLISELKRKNYGIERYPSSFDKTIEYLKKQRVSFNDPNRPRKSSPEDEAKLASRKECLRSSFK